MYNDNFMNAREQVDNSLLRQILENSNRADDDCGCERDSDTRSAQCCERHSHNACGSDGCGSSCRESSWGLVGYPLASVYAPLQEFDELFDLDTALEKGTIFKQLDLPFLGSKQGSSCGCSVCGGTRNG